MAVSGSQQAILRILSATLVGNGPVSTKPLAFTGPDLHNRLNEGIAWWQFWRHWSTARFYLEMDRLEEGGHVTSTWAEEVIDGTPVRHKGYQITTKGREAV